MPQTAQDHQLRIESVGKWRIRIRSYRLGDIYVCRVDNVDPGAVIARAKSATREDAESQAVEEARAAIGG